MGKIPPVTPLESQIVHISLVAQDGILRGLFTPSSCLDEKLGSGLTRSARLPSISLFVAPALSRIIVLLSLHGPCLTA